MVVGAAGKLGRRVVIGKPDPSLTSAAGLVAVAELDVKLGITAALDGCTELAAALHSVEAAC